MFLNLFNRIDSKATMVLGSSIESLQKYTLELGFLNLYRNHQHSLDYHSTNHDPLFLDSIPYFKCRIAHIDLYIASDCNRAFQTNS